MIHHPPPCLTMMANLCTFLWFVRDRQEVMSEGIPLTHFLSTLKKVLRLESVVITMNN